MTDELDRMIAVSGMARAGFPVEFARECFGILPEPAAKPRQPRPKDIALEVDLHEVEVRVFAGLPRNPEKRGDRYAKPTGPGFPTT